MSQQELEHMDKHVELTPMARVFDQLLVAVRSPRSKILAMACNLLIGDVPLFPILKKSISGKYENNFFFKIETLRFCTEAASIL